MSTASNFPRQSVRQYGIEIGVMRPGKRNAITDVVGVRVGHTTLIEGDAIRTGVTAIIPASGNLFERKVPAAIYVGNGFGKIAGCTQVRELGNLETPILLTNTLGVAAAMEGIIEYTLMQEGNERVVSVNALVGETNDGALNDIRQRRMKKEHALAAIASASEEFAQGCVGAGTGTVCFGFKGGIGSASRLLPMELGGYTVGCLVQTNFGGELRIGGAGVGKRLKKFAFDDKLNCDADGSCIIVVATDAPMDARNLERLAKRAFMGLARTGGIASNGSGDYAVAFSTADQLRVAHSPKHMTQRVELLHNDHVSALFMAAIEASEEAIINSLFYAEGMTGMNGKRVDALPLQEVVPMVRGQQ